MGSRARLVSLLFAFLLARLAKAGPPAAAAAAAAAGSRYLTQDERWMKQRLDHFSPIVSQLHHPIMRPTQHSRNRARP